jgi:hypothetical protein
MLVPGYTANFDENIQKQNVDKVSEILQIGAENSQPRILFKVPPNLKYQAIQYIAEVDSVPIESGNHDYVLMIVSEKKNECVMGSEYGYAANDANYVRLTTQMLNSSTRGGTVIFQHDIAACGRRSWEFIEDNLARHSLRNLGL